MKKRRGTLMSPGGAGCAACAGNRGDAGHWVRQNDQIVVLLGSSRRGLEEQLRLLGSRPGARLEREVQRRRSNQQQRLGCSCCSCEEETEDFLGGIWNWAADLFTPTSERDLQYAVKPGEEYGGKWKSKIPPGLPPDVRKAGAAMSALPHVRDLARKQGLGEVFIGTVEQMAVTESGARFALPANSFNAKPPSERGGKPLITAWGTFQFNRDAWTCLFAEEERKLRKSYRTNGTLGCSGCGGKGGCVFPWDSTAYEEITRPINHYAELFREVRAGGGSEIDAARGLRLWHISPTAYRGWRDRGKRAGFNVAWQQVSSSLKQRITTFLRHAGVV
jgi:hypothetical protein